MNRIIFFLCALIILVSCSKHDEAYFRSNPQAVQKALELCPKKAPQHYSCEGLKKLSMQFASLGYQLHTSPQQFGQQILELQETVARQKKSLQKNPNDQALKMALKQTQQQLKERLAVVKWLESPEG